MIDRLLDKIDSYENPTVVGLDPTIEMIPEYIKTEMYGKYGKTPRAVAEMFLVFNKTIMDNLMDIVPAIKPQIAMYEKFGIDGIEAYIKTNAYAKAKGFMVIGDIKRGDISSTAAAYAAHIGGTEIEGAVFDLWNEDSVTLNPYLGFDGIESFVKPCNERDKGIFILVKTSNPSSGELQDLMAGATGAITEKEVLAGGINHIYERTAALVSEWGEQAMGQRGYSKIGAVVGATYKEQGIALRKIMPHTFFLVPGYGAQGGTGADLKGFFDKAGRGCIVNSSRGIIAAYKKSSRFTEREFGTAAREAALEMKKDLKNGLWG